jgi:hypothetical protein
VSFERPVDFALSKKRLKVRRERLDGLVGQFLARLDVFGAIGAVVRHIVPLHRELFARRWRLAGGEELRDAEHLFKTARVVARRRQQILPDLVVPAWGQIDVLDVSGHLTIKDCADEEAHGAMEALFVFFDDSLVREVVFQDLSPGSFVTAFENILELGESLVPVPIQPRSGLDEIWEGLLVKELHPKRSAVQVDFSFPSPTRKLVFFWQFCGVIPWPFVAEDGLFLENTGHLG